jgi:hypothetical protein
MQSVSTMIARPIALRNAAVFGLAGFLAGAAITLNAPAIASGLGASGHHSSATIPVVVAGPGLAAHNRSEAGLANLVPGVGMAAHNRSEEGLANGN